MESCTCQRGGPPPPPPPPPPTDTIDQSEWSSVQAWPLIHTGWGHVRLQKTFRHLVVSECCLQQQWLSCTNTNQISFAGAAEQARVCGVVRCGLGQRRSISGSETGRAAQRLAASAQRNGSNCCDRHVGLNRLHEEVPGGVGENLTQQRIVKVRTGSIAGSINPQWPAQSTRAVLVLNSCCSKSTVTAVAGTFVRLFGSCGKNVPTPSYQNFGFSPQPVVPGRQTNLPVYPNHHFQRHQ